MFNIDIKTLQNFIGQNPFQVCLEFQPLAPIDVALPILSSLTMSSHAKIEVEIVA
jgi:hypothetical protein